MRNLLRRFVSAGLSATLVFSLSLSGINFAQAETLDDGLVAHYPFNGNANDESGNGNDGTVYGATLIEDRFGNVNSAYSFDGSNDYIESTSDLFSGNEITTSLWAFVDISSSGGVLLEKIDVIEQNGSNYGTSMGKGDELLYINVRTEDSRDDNDYYASKTSDSETPIQENSWIHIVQTLTSDKTELFINGQLAATYNLPEGFIPYMGDAPLQIGGFPLSNHGSKEEAYFHGIIDDIRIYNRPLSETEIQTLYLITSNTAPTLTLTEPDGLDDTADTSYEITWTDEDPDEDATISLYYDTDNTGTDGTLIADNISEDDETDSYTWDTTAVSEGSYYIYAVIEDGVNDPVTTYSSNLVTIDHLDSSNEESTNSCTTSGQKDDGTYGTCAEVDILGGTVTIAAPATIDFGDHTVSSTDQTSEVTLSDSNYFSLEDLQGSSSGYYTTLQVADLVDGTKTISASNLRLKVTDGTVHTLGGSGDANVVVPSGTQDYLNFTSDSPATLLERSSDSDGLLGKYGVLPSFELTIPAYQTIGSYTGTITYTLIEN